MLSSLDSLPNDFDQFWYHQVQPHLALGRLMTTVREANAFITRHEPWHLPLGGSNLENRLMPGTREVVLSVVLEALRLASYLLSPATPRLAVRLLTRLGYLTTKKQIAQSVIVAKTDFNRLPAATEGSVHSSHTFAFDRFRNLGPSLEGPFLLRF
ncbi:unnamed protein product [Protopolystoma xenopodis]|uniref:Uncharacterized protein n=1 Tax=Protopolystoma xenopodis TaxID=117903 RepID=A0A448WYE2_9PLAT|nr:unnamed protein product [Protopolystoma xenopodis]